VNTTYDLGLSSSSRLHDLFVSTEAMSPGEFKNAGLNVVIRWSVEETPFGWALFAETEKGLCRVSFVMNEQEAVEDLKRSWPLADIRHDPKTLQFTIEEILRRMTGGTAKETLGVLLRGTPFRLKIWRALMEVPRGTLASYQTIAQMVGQPGAVRAVASSIGANPLAFLIPCHRVIRQTGIFGQYHWGEDRKLAMIGRELLEQYDSR
jgi:AraC family transcriptional regulator of adaptative response/methylated-DNA-[protein]-cysteine methyltransferase